MPLKPTLMPRRFEGRSVVVTGAGTGFGADHGLVGLTMSYAHALAPKVRVNTFAPGCMETEATLAREDWQSGRADQLRLATPMGHIPAPRWEHSRGG